MKAYFWTFNFSLLIFFFLHFCQENTVLITDIFSDLWNKDEWALQVCSFTRLFGLPRAPWISTWILGSSCQFLQERKQNFDTGSTESEDQFGEYCHLQGIVFWSTNMGCCSIYFFQQIFEVFSIQMSLVLLLIIKLFIFLVLIFKSSIYIQDSRIQFNSTYI